MSHFLPTPGVNTIHTVLTPAGVSQMLNGGSINVTHYNINDCVNYNLYDTTADPGQQDAYILSTPISAANTFANYYFLTTVDQNATSLSTVIINNSHNNSWKLIPGTLYTIRPVTSTGNDSSYTFVLSSMEYFASYGTAQSNLKTIGTTKSQGLTLVGDVLYLRSNAIIQSTASAKLKVLGNVSGATTSIQFNV